MGSQITGPATPGASPPSPPIGSASAETGEQDRDNANGLVVRGLWCYLLRPRTPPRNLTAARKLRHDHLAAVAAHGYKIGVKLKTTQQLTTLAFQGPQGEFSMVQDTNVTNELEASMPTGADEHWIGLLPPAGSKRRPRRSKKAPLRICYDFRLVVTPVLNPPQLVPLVVTYADASFATHYLMTVVLLSDAIPRVTLVTSAQL